MFAPRKLKSRKRCAPLRHRKLAIEPLEERRLLAIDSSFSKGVLNISSDWDDPITVTEQKGLVKINGADPASGPLLADLVTHIDVTAGAMGGVVQLSGIDMEAFPSLEGTSIKRTWRLEVIDEVLNRVSGSSLVQYGASFMGPRVEALTLNEMTTLSQLVRPEWRSIDLTTITDEQVSDARAKLKESGRSLPALEELLKDGTLKGDAIDNFVSYFGGALRAGPGSLRTASAEIPGTDGDDTLIGTSEGDLIDGGEGDDQIWGMGGDDIIDGGEGDDRIYGDFASGIDGIEEKLHTGQGAGDDDIDGGEGIDTIYGEDGIDTILAGTIDDSDIIDGGAGDDIINTYTNQADQISGDSGLDTLNVLTVLIGTGADGVKIDNQHVSHTSPYAVVSSYSGIEVLNLNMDTENDLIVVNLPSSGQPALPGAINLTGGAGTDAVTVVGTSGIDLMTASNNSIAIGGTVITLATIEAVTLDGAGQNDTIDLSLASTSLAGTPLLWTLQGGAGNDTLTGSGGADTLDGGDANDAIFGGPGLDDLLGAAGDDVLYGDEGGDTLAGGAGNDYLAGGSESDTLQGGPGSDYLVGGEGTDSLVGGDGIDRFETDANDPPGAPTLDAIAGLTFRKDQAAAFRILADDTEDDYAALQFSVVVTGPDATIYVYAWVAGGIFSWQPGANVSGQQGDVDIGAYNVTITVTDTNQETAQTSFTITVSDFNEAPPNGPNTWRDDFPHSGYSFGHTYARDIDGYDSQTASQNVTHELVAGPPDASMSSGGVLTWAIPEIPSSGAIDPQWYSAYRFLLKFTDDGAGGGGSRSRTVAVFNSPELDVSLAGGVGTEPGVIYNKDTPIAVDDFMGTPVGQLLASDVTRGGITNDFYWHDGDFAPTTGTFELVGGGPSHAASFNWNAASGEFTYLPVAGYEGLDSFTYRIDNPNSWSEENHSTSPSTYNHSDHNYSNVATVTIQVGKPVRAYLDVQAEEIPNLGYVLGANTDDDNENGVEDFDELSGPLSGEDDLLEVELSHWLRADGYAPDFVAGLQMSHDNIIRIWDSPTKNKEILASVGEHEGDHWLLADLPETIWVEGVSTGYTGLTLAILGRATSMFTGMVFAWPVTPEDYTTVVLNVFALDLSVDLRDFSPNPLVLVDSVLTDTSLADTYVQLETVNVFAALPPSVDYEDFWVSLDVASGTRLWADAERTTEIDPADPLLFFGHDLFDVLYVEAPMGTGEALVVAQLESSDPFLQQEPLVEAWQGTKLFKFADDSRDLAVEKGAGALGSMLKSALDINLKAPLLQALDQQEAALDPNGPNYQTLKNLLDQARSEADTYVNTMAGFGKTMAFDTLQKTSELFLPERPNARPPKSVSDVFKKYTLGDGDPKPPFDLVFNPNFAFSEFVAAIDLMFSGNNQAVVEYVLSPQRLGHVGLRINFEGPGGSQPSIEIGASEIVSFTEPARNTYYGNFVFPETQFRDVWIQGGAEYSVTPIGGESGTYREIQVKLEIKR